MMYGWSHHMHICKIIWVKQEYRNMRSQVADQEPYIGLEFSTMLRLSQNAMLNASLDLWDVLATMQ